MATRKNATPKKATEEPSRLDTLAERARAEAREAYMNRRIFEAAQESARWDQFMRRVALSVAGALLGAACVALLVTLPATAPFWAGHATPQPRIVAPAQPRINVFETARQSTVAVEKDGQIVGTGFLVKSGGVTYLWTAAHVVTCDPTCEHTYEVTVRVEHDDVLVGRQRYQIEPVKIDPLWDIAVFRVLDPPVVPGVKFAGRARVPIGTPVFQIGNMMGPHLEGSVTFGRVSKLGHNDANLGLWPFDQTDVTTMPGSSGGPVFSLSGEVVGMIIGGLREFRDLGFMIPVKNLRAWAAKDSAILDLFPH